MSEGAMWSVGQAGRAAGVSRKAIRVYEARGLLAPSGRTRAGYRLFSDTDVDRLRFIRRARTLGMGLDVIAEVIAKRRDGGAPCALVRGRLAQRVAEIDQAIGELRALRATLLEATDRCPPDPDEAAICPIIDSVGEPGQ